MAPRILRVGTAGLGMIFDDTYRPFLLAVNEAKLYSPQTGPVTIELAATASRTGARVAQLSEPTFRTVTHFTGADAGRRLAAAELDAVCVATPDDRHFETALASLEAGKHVLIEKPSVLSLQELDRLTKAATNGNALAKVVYHKLLDPDHKKLRTHVADGVLTHVNNGYCSLLEPKSVGLGQFAEWVTGRNPATYVAVHYLKLIDFTFGPNWRLARISAAGQRGIVGAASGPTWDSVQLRVIYAYPDGREAAFDIHTSWVTPDDFPGSVEQEVQFRFDNGVWNASQRRRGVELTVEGRTPGEIKMTPNHHYNGTFLEPWNARSQRGYGIEAIERFFREVAYVEYGGLPDDRPARLQEMRALTYNDLTADRNVVAAVQAVEAILRTHATDRPGSLVTVNGPHGGLVQSYPGEPTIDVLYAPPV
ncbi:MAG TPA: Gfo/Idh/MocA family oxidoreductase [Fimbriiglobus sp.]|jgi:predicted dehydrogenase